MAKFSKDDIVSAVYNDSDESSVTVTLDDGSIALVVMNAGNSPHLAAFNGWVSDGGVVAPSEAPAGTHEFHITQRILALEDRVKELEDAQALVRSTLVLST